MEFCDVVLEKPGTNSFEISTLPLLFLQDIHRVCLGCFRQIEYGPNALNAIAVFRFVNKLSSFVGCLYIQCKEYFDQIPMDNIGFFWKGPMTILFAARQPCDFPTTWAGPELAPEGAPGGNSCQPGLESVQQQHLCLPWSYRKPGTSAFGHNERGNTGLRDIQFDQHIHTYLFGASVTGFQKRG